MWRTATKLGDMLPVRNTEGSSTLLVTLILLLLSGACLALLMATGTQMLIASGQKLQVRLLAAAEGGLDLAVARGIAGADDPYVRTLDGEGPSGEITVDVAGLAPVADGPCHLCMANLDGALAPLGGLRRISHVAEAVATAPERRPGLPPPRRELTAVVDLMPWPVDPRDGREVAETVAAARALVRDAALNEIGAYDDEAPITVRRVVDPESGTERTIAVGGLGRSGRLLHAFELSPETGPLWRFADGADEDGNGAADLGLTVSKPAVLRLRLGDGARLVAVFGGGFDPEASVDAGNWLYFVGIDGGQILYKRAVDAPVTAAPAAVDTTGDGLADRIYVGTTAGSLYRVDVSSRVEPENGRVPSGAWRPRRLFDTGGLPIHHPPAVIPVPALEAHALALGAGGADPGVGGEAANVSNPVAQTQMTGGAGPRVWAEALTGRRPSGAATPPTDTEDAVVGRFFVFVDDGAGGPRSADDLPVVDPDSSYGSDDRLVPTRPYAEQGWSLALGPGERPASAPLVAGGLLTFFTLQPAGPSGGEVRKYALRLGSGDAAGFGPRAQVVGRSASWPSPALGAPTGIEIDPPGSWAASLLRPDEVEILEGLRDQMPERCRFDGSNLRLSGPGPDGSPIRLAVLPVCRIEADWADRGF